MHKYCGFLLMYIVKQLVAIISYLIAKIPCQDPTIIPGAIQSLDDVEPDSKLSEGADYLFKPVQTGLPTPA